MKWKARLVLLLSMSMTLSSISQAQYGWGVGLYGGMQACPYNWGGAGGATDPADEVEDMKDQLREAKAEVKELTKDMRNLDKEISRADESISGQVNGDYIERVLQHMQFGYNCAKSCYGNRGSSGSSSSVVTT